MSGFGRLLKFFKDKAPFTSRMPTLLAEPKRVRKYTDIELPTITTYTQMEPPPKNENVVVLTALMKQCVLLQLEYRDYLFKKTNIFSDKPEYVEKCYDLMDLVNSDKPVQKDALQSQLELPLKEKYKDLDTGGPEHEKVFFAQQNQLVVMNPKTPPPSNLQKAGKPGEFESSLGSFMVKDVADAEPLLDFLSAEEINRRHIYIWQETKDTFMESLPVIEKLAAKLGNVYSAMDYIVLKGDKRTPEEQKVIDGMERIDKLMRLHEEYKANIFKYLMLRPVLPFPMPDYLQKMYQEKLRYLWQECYVEDITEFLGIPDRTEESKKEMELRYQRATDIEAMSDKDRKSALKLIEEKGDELIVRRNLSAKDEALISKMNILANTVEVKKHPEPRPDFSMNFNPEMLKSRLREQMATDVGQGLLSPENIVKVLYLNNARPQEFDLLYWTEILNLPPQKIRNIFNHISYPVIINNTVVGKLSFVDIPRKKTIVDLEEENLKQFRSQNRANSL